MASLEEYKVLIGNFYEANEKDKVIDVEGMAQWTLQNGEDALNEMLKFQYNKTIDFSQSPAEGDSSMMTLSQFKKPKLDDETLQRENLRQKLEDYFIEVDPDFDEAAVNELVEVGMTLGEDKINNDLIDKYGEGFLTEDEEEEEEVPVFEFDELKVKQELRVFYQKHDPAYLETPDHLDQVLDLMSQIGKEAVYEKLFGFYNERVEDVVRAHNAQELRESMRSRGELSAFDNIDELRENLKKYYNKHDTEEAENIDDVIALGMDIGYGQLNENMEALYGESLRTFLNGEKPPPVKKSKLRMLHESRKLKNKPKKSNIKAVMLEVEPEAKNSPLPSPKFRKKKNKPVVDSMSFNGAGSMKIEKERIRTPVVINPPTIARDNIPASPMPQTPQTPMHIPAIPPRVPPRRSEMDTPRAAPATPVMTDPRPVTPPRTPARPTTPPSSRHRRLPKKPESVASTSNEVKKEELINFYEKHDVAKLSLIEKIMKVAKKIGRERLNTKLMNFYSANLDTYVHELSLPQASYVEPFNQRGSVPYDDLDQLREDLLKFYQKFDPLKINDLDQIVQLGKRMGRKALVGKLEQIYQANVDVYCGRRGSRAVQTAIKHRTPPQTPNFNSGPVPPPRTVENTYEAPPFPSKHPEPPHAQLQYGVSPLPERPSDTNYGSQFDVKNVPAVGRIESNEKVRKIRNKGVPMIPMAGMAISGVQLKKTGRNVHGSLSRKPKKDKKYVNSMYRLPKKKRYTAASMKLLSVQLNATSLQATVEGGGDLKDYEAPVRKKKKMRTKVDVADLMV